MVDQRVVRNMKVHALRVARTGQGQDFLRAEYEQGGHHPGSGRIPSFNEDTQGQHGTSEMVKSGYSWRRGIHGSLSRGDESRPVLGQPCS